MKRMLAVMLVYSGCAAGPDRPPIARIEATPTAILVQDDFATEVVLDGTSSVALDDPDAVLDFAWQLLDDEARTDQDLRSPTLTARFRGDTPPRVVLTVTTPDGLRGTATEPILLTLP